MNEEYYNNLLSKLKKAWYRAKTKYPKDTMLKLTDKEIQDLAYLWEYKAKEIFSLKGKLF